MWKGYALLCVMMLALTVSARAECTCVYQQGEVKEGQTACIQTVKGPSMARCSKVQNVTSWQVLNQPCPVNQSRLVDQPNEKKS